MVRKTRRVALAIAAIMLIGSWAAAPVSAFIPPGGGGGNSQCQYQWAGYAGKGVWKDSGDYVWDGELQWQMCIVRTASGLHYALVQLSSPAAPSARYDQFTGLVYVYLQACYGLRAFTTLSSVTWSVPYRVTGTQSGGRYYFAMVQTPTSASGAPTGYRVHIQSWAAGVVSRTGSLDLALSARGFTGPGTDAYFNTSCLNP